MTKPIKLPPLPNAFAWAGVNESLAKAVQAYTIQAIEADRNEREGCENHISRQGMGALSRQQIIDRFGFLEGIVSEHNFRRIYETAIEIVAVSDRQARGEPCLTCNDNGAVGNILNAEPCPDCTPQPQQQKIEPVLGPFTLDVESYEPGFRDINRPGHPGFMRVVWKMEDDDRSPECEKVAHFVIDALNAADRQARGEPVLYQSRTRPIWAGASKNWTAWKNCTKDQANDYRRVKVLHDWEYEVRELYTAPQPQQQVGEPLFWYRPIADGMYEGPVHNNSVGGKMLRDEKPGEWKPLYGAPQPQQIPEGYKLVLIEPADNQWDGLARDFIKAWEFGCKTPRDMFKFIEDCGGEIPQWVREEPEMKNLDHVPSKGTRAVLIYKAMLEAVPEPKGES